MTSELLYRIALLIHVLSAVIWVGGVLFMGMIAVPAAKKFNDELRRKLLDELGRKFRTVGWTAISLLIVTGIFFMWKWGATFGTVFDLSFFEHSHTRLLGYKLLLIVAMIVISGLHDFWLGPRATKPGRSTEEIARDRRLASLMGRATGILVILIVALAIFIARPWV